MPTDDYARLSPALLTMLATERTVAEMKAALDGSSERWWLAITDAHQALTAALVGTISGSAEIGALSTASKKAMIQYFDSPSVGYPTNANYIARFSELLDRACDASNVNDMYGTLILTDRQREDLLKLNGFRDDLAHVKPGSWSLEIAGLPRIFGAVAEALRQLFEMPRLRMALEDDEFDRALRAIETLLSLAPAKSAPGAGRS